MSKRNQTPLRVDRRFHALDDLPLWLQAIFSVQADAWLKDTLSTCMHSPTFRSQIPAHMAAWKPQLVTCPGCTHLLELPPNDPANFRCDSCEQQVTNTPDDQLFMAHVKLGSLTLAFAVCPRCRGKMA